MSAAPDEHHRADAQCIRRVRQGDTEAYAPVVRRALPRLRALMWRFFKNADDADDFSQAALVRAFEQLDRYDASRPFYPWLRRIAVNLALHELEKRKRMVGGAELEIALQREEAIERSDAVAQERELIERTESELDRMPPAWAAVFRLRCVEEMSYAEIAACLAIPVGTVMSRLARARSRLAEALAEEFGPRTEVSP